MDWTVYVVAIGFVWDIPLKINFETCQSDQVHFLQLFFFEKQVGNFPQSTVSSTERPCLNLKSI